MMAEPNFLSIYSLCEQAEARGKRKEDPICDHACLKGSSRATGVRRGGEGRRGEGQRAEGVRIETLLKGESIAISLEKNLIRLHFKENNVRSLQNLDEFLLSTPALATPSEDYKGD